MSQLTAEEMDGGVVSFPRRRRADVEMDITPMIDITFLLLIFFLVASHLEKGASVTLPAAHHGTSVVQDQSVILTIANGPQGRGLVYLGDGADAATLVTGGSEEALDAAIADYVTAGLAGSAPKRYVLIKAAHDLRHREVDRVRAAVSGIELDEPPAIHTAVLEAK